MLNKYPPVRRRHSTLRHHSEGATDVPEKKYAFDNRVFRISLKKYLLGTLVLSAFPVLLLLSLGGKTHTRAENDQDYDKGTPLSKVADTTGLRTHAAVKELEEAEAGEAAVAAKRILTAATNDIVAAKGGEGVEGTSLHTAIDPAKHDIDTVAIVELEKADHSHSIVGKKERPEELVEELTVQVDLAGDQGPGKINGPRARGGVTPLPQTEKNKGYNTAKKFKGIDKLAPTEDLYITLWLHQVHSWFKEDNTQSTAAKVKDFLSEAKQMGFTHLMSDIPWAWTEREEQGNVDIDSFNKGDVLPIACELGMPLHVIVTMREFPPWVNTDENNAFFETGSNHKSCSAKKPRRTTGISAAHPLVWEWAQKYLASVSEKILAKYGHCIASISPTLNNEFETRYTQTFGMMRDYSESSVAAYRAWQVDAGSTSVIETSRMFPPEFSCGPICMPTIDKGVSQWLGYREEFLSNKYIELCKIVKREHITKDGVSHHPDCLLHIGEMFSSTDALNSNPFFKLAQSPYVDHLVMDSNMALFGAPSSPSIVGILVSTAQAYGKSVHYKAATERILLCDDKGKLKATHNGTGVSLLFQSGIARALEAGVHSLGVTNLCAPSALGRLLNNNKQQEVKDLRVSLQRASSFEPTAVIFVPYRAFYAYSFVITGSTCGIEHTDCWHESFKEIPVFGHGKHTKKPGMCNVDHGQLGLIRAWDDLRTRHRQVAVIADPEKLADDLLSSATERVILTFPCVMTENSWHFHEGETILARYRQKSRNYPFLEVLLDMPGSCPESVLEKPTT